MKKLNIIVALAAVAAMGSLSSCDADKEPVLYTPSEFQLATPAYAGQYLELETEKSIDMTCVKPDYGMPLAITYSIEISLTENFGAAAQAEDDTEAPTVYTITPEDPQSTEITISTKNIAEGICAMRGITKKSEYTDEPARPVYVRAVASVNGQAATRVTSNVVTLSQVKGYFAVASTKLNVLYTPGDSNGWNQGNSQQLAEYEDGKYRGFAHLKGSFKFTNAPNWDDTNYGAGEDAGTLSTDGKAGNLTVDADGLYYCNVDVNALTYTLTPITTIGLIGDATPEGWGASTPLSPSEDFLTWSAQIALTDGELKFRCNDGWDINLGGALDNLQFGEGNIKAVNTGNVTVTLKLGTLPYTATIE